MDFAIWILIGLCAFFMLKFDPQAHWIFVGIFMLILLSSDRRVSPKGYAQAILVGVIILVASAGWSEYAGLWTVREILTLDGFGYGMVVCTMAYALIFASLIRLVIALFSQNDSRGTHGETKDVE